MGWKRFASAELLFSPMLSSMFATTPVVPTTFCTSNTSWSNSLQRQHIFPVGVALQSDTASSAQAGMTLPQWVCIPLILHRPRCGSCSGGRWLGGQPLIFNAGCTGPPTHLPPPRTGIFGGQAFVPGERCSLLIYGLCPVPAARGNAWVYRMGFRQP